MSGLAYIVFLTRPDEELGFTLLMQRTPVHAYAQGVYGVDRSACSILDEREVRYREATEEEISSTVPGHSVRDPAAAHLQ